MCVHYSGTVSSQEEQIMSLHSMKQVAVITNLPYIYIYTSTMCRITLRGSNNNRQITIAEWNTYMADSQSSKIV